MTLEERNKLVSDNIKLVYSFCNKYYHSFKAYYFSKEDMISELVVKLLENIHLYDEKRGLVSTFFFVVMLTSAVIHRRSSLGHSMEFNYKMLSLDNPVNGKYNDSDNLRYIDLMSYDEEVSDIIYKGMLMEDINKYVIPEVIEYYIYGLTMTEIAKRRGISFQAVSVKIKRNLKMIKANVDYTFN